jgi:hypothetical protein
MGFQRGSAPPFRGSCPERAGFLKASIAKGLKDEPSACTVAHDCASAFSRRPTRGRRGNPPVSGQRTKRADFVTARAAVGGSVCLCFAVQTAGGSRSPAESRPYAASQPLLPELPARRSRACRSWRWGRPPPSDARAGDVNARRLLLRRLRSRVARLALSEVDGFRPRAMRPSIGSIAWPQKAFSDANPTGAGPNCFPVAAPPYLGSTSGG